MWWIETVQLPSKTAKTILIAGQEISDFQWSPDMSMYLAAEYYAGHTQILTLTHDGGSQHWLTTNGTNYDPQWSADGQTIYFDSIRDGYQDIYTMSEYGENQKPLMPQ